MLDLTNSENIYFDFWIKSVRIDNTNSSPFTTLLFQNNPNSRTALSGIGPKVKFQPFKQLSRLSIQSTFLFPTAQDLEGVSNGRPFLSQDSYISITQVFMIRQLAKKFNCSFHCHPGYTYRKNLFQTYLEQV